MLTFDDGYRDNLHLAAPILGELGVPAAIFLCTSFLDGELPWWDRLALAVRASRLDRFRVDRPEPMVVERGEVGPLVASYLRADRPDDPAHLEHLEDRAEVGLPEAGGLFLDWDEARSLAAHGIEVGAHTISHRRLSRLSDSELSEELAGSKARIERELGRPVSAIAYPYGDPTAADSRVHARAREVGYRLGFALRPGFVGPGSDPMDLPRLHVVAADTPALVRARVGLVRAFGRSRL